MVESQIINRIMIIFVSEVDLGKYVIIHIFTTTKELYNRKTTSIYE